jgi:spore coat protein A, manganese oxidase
LRNCSPLLAQESKGLKIPLPKEKGMKKPIVLTMLCAFLVLAFPLLAFARQMPASDYLQQFERFTDPVPVPERINATQGGNVNVEMNETEQWLGLYDSSGEPLLTTVWGYGRNRARTTYPGPTFIARKDVPIRVRWMNKLPRYQDPPHHLLPVDTTVHLNESQRRALQQGRIPTVPHLHGGHTESASDGLPEAWFTQGWAEVGPHWVKRRFEYANDQDAATLWYHDHALGITRLNVYAGLAGFYLLRDDVDTGRRFRRNPLTGASEPNPLPRGPYEIELVIQDRMFTEEGQLFLPSDPLLLEEVPDDAPNPSIVAEFFGDFILVNGRVWPYLDVEPRQYRFRLANGSDSRFYVLRFDNGMGFYQIGSDTGLLETPAALDQLLLGPGERADLVVDFTGRSGSEFILENIGPDEPFKGLGVGDPADPETTGQVMKFRVNREFRGTVPSVVVTAGTRLNEIDRLGNENRTRLLGLFEGEDEHGRLMPLLGVVDPTMENGSDVGPHDLVGSLGWDQEITERPGLGDVEVWELYNTTEDAHPIHLHLVRFQILNRQDFEGELTEKDQPQQGSNQFGVGQVLTDIELEGPAMGPDENEAGWKDTVIALPDQVTRIIARFDRPGRYVWHCHILSHEDHEMMRPYVVVARDQEPNIPAGHMPPPGECRIWYPDVPPGQQPPPGDCDELRDEVPEGAWLIEGRRNRTE